MTTLGTLTAPVKNSKRKTPEVDGQTAWATKKDEQTMLSQTRSKNKDGKIVKTFPPSTASSMHGLEIGAKDKHRKS